VKLTRRHIAPLIGGSTLFAFAVPALAGPAAQVTANPLSVLSLIGTPHLWIADEQGILHWGGDTRGLVGRNINWSDRRDITLDQLRAFRRGDPWLSAGLLKQGDPIYQVKWETNQDRPTLLHIQSIADVEIFGIDATNYGRFVLDAVAWEQRYGISVASLTRGVLQPAVPPAATATSAATASPTPGALTVREVGYDHDSSSTGSEITVTLEIAGVRPGQRLTVSCTLDECTSSDCSSTRSDKWGPFDAGPANTEGKVRWSDRHSYYKAYTYTFTDPQGNTVSKTYGNDMVRTGKISA
jgi:hypothetical protein